MIIVDIIMVDEADENVEELSTSLYTATLLLTWGSLNGDVTVKYMQSIVLFR